VRLSLILRDGTLAILRIFRDFVSALQTIARSLEALASIQRLAAPASERLDALELSRHQFEAEMEGLLLKADGKLKAASNAEARERQLKKSYEANLDSFSEDGDQGSSASPIPPNHAEAGEAEGVSPLHLDVAPNNKALALRAKWGSA